jgi:hypothetical protein
MIIKNFQIKSSISFTRKISFIINYPIIKIFTLIFSFNLLVLSNLYSQTIKICYASKSSGLYTIGGSQRSAADDKLTNTANFGPTGTSPYTISLFDFGTTTITEALLSSNGCQIFDAGFNNSDAGGSGTTFFSASERTALTNWGATTNHDIIQYYLKYYVI